MVGRVSSRGSIWIFYIFESVNFDILNGLFHFLSMHVGAMGRRLNFKRDRLCIKTTMEELKTKIFQL